MRPVLLVLLLASCKLYAPEVRDCAFRCGAKESCPKDTVCSDGWCRVANPVGYCDCKQGEERACGANQGECREGKQVCTADGSWGLCTGEVKPAQEVCDNKDNNCDGVVDNALAGGPACPLTQGVCGLATRPCVAGRFEACTEADYGLNYQRVESLCDGLDNDCDGVVDAAPEVKLLDAVSGEWELLGYPGGFALISQDASDVIVDRYDEEFAHLSTARTPRGPSPKFVARNDGSDVYVVLIQSGTLVASKITLSGAVLPLGTATVSDATEPWQVGASSEVLVATYRSATSGARSVEWPLDGGAAIARRLDVPDALSVASVYASLGGKYVVWSGTTTTGAVTQVRTVQTDLEVGAGLSPGPQSATVLEAPMGQLVSVYSEATATSSGVYLVQNLIDAGTQMPVRTDPDPTAIGPVHATRGTGGALMTWAERTTAISLASQLAVGAQSVFTIRTLELDAGVVSSPRVAWIGARMMGLAWERGGRVYARKVCPP